MGKMDGYEFLQAVREQAHWQHIPFIFISGTPEPEVKSYLAHLGVVAYLNKPFQARCLLSAVEKALATPDNARLHSAFTTEDIEISIKRAHIAVQSLN